MFQNRNKSVTVKKLCELLLNINSIIRKIALSKLRASVIFYLHFIVKFFADIRRIRKTYMIGKKNNDERC